MIKLAQSTLWLELVAVTISAVFYLLLCHKKENLIYKKIARLSYIGFAVFSTFASFLLMYFILTHDFRFKYIILNSSSDLQLSYLISSFWAGQEGSFLLWILLGAWLGLVLLYKLRHTEPHVMVLYNLPHIFLSILLIKQSPFATVINVPNDGMGMNMLLQDPWMVIHPPIVFLGYAAFTIPFAFAMSSLWRREYNDWIKQGLPWALFAFVTLGAGIIIGGVWSYRVLGWGGYWGWDPVENASLLPWLTGIALLHGLILQKSTGRLAKTNYFLAAISFVLIIYSTFLTRSGVLANFSVHTFGDLGITGWLVFFMFAFLFISGYLIISRSKEIPLPKNHKDKQTLFLWQGIGLFIASILFIVLQEIRFSVNFGSILSEFLKEIGISVDVAFVIFMVDAFMIFVVVVFTILLYRSRESGLFGAVILLCLSAVLIGLGTSAPLITRVLENQSKVPTQFYVNVNLPIAILIGLLLSYVPLLKSGKNDLTKLFPKMISGCIVAVIFSIFTLIKGFPGITIFLMVLFAGFTIGVNLELMIRLIKKSFAASSGAIAHLGLGLMFFTFVVSSIYDKSERVALPQGEVKNVLGYDIKFIEPNFTQQPGGVRLYLPLEIKKENKLILAQPDIYEQFQQGGNKRFNHPFILRGLWSDLYISPNDFINEKKEVSSNNHLVVKMGEPIIYNDYEIKFTGYDLSVMKQVEQLNGSMSVGADLLVSYKGSEAVSLKPIFTVGEKKGQLDRVKLPGQEEAYLTIVGMEVGQKIIELHYDGPKPATSEEQKVSQPPIFLAEVSIKPGITLLWVGVTLLLLGGVVAIYRRSPKRRD